MEQKNVILTMQYEDGSKSKRELLSIFTANNGCSYAALLQVNDDESVQDNASIELVRIKTYKNDKLEVDYLIERITTEAEFKTATEAFEQLEMTVDSKVNEVDETSVEDLPVLSFKNAQGKFEEWKVVDVFDHNNRKYIALIPMLEIKDGTNIEIHLMRVTLTAQGEIEGCEVSSIPSDMEYEEVSKIFERRVNEANNI